jgi:hypothetical protein
VPRVGGNQSIQGPGEWMVTEPSVFGKKSGPMCRCQEWELRARANWSSALRNHKARRYWREKTEMLRWQA